MTATTVPAPLDDRRPALATLTQVELRKMTDTRAGRWLLSVIGVLLVAIPVIYAFAGDADEKTYSDFFQIVQLPTGVLLPVLGILLVTSEWTQRTALTTFTLVPDRTRIVLAKVLAVIAICLGAIVITLVAAALGVLLAGGEGDWTFGADVLGEVVLTQVAGVLVGLAFGLAFQSSAPAIVLYFVLPTIISVLGHVFGGGFQDALQWVDFNDASFEFGEGDASGTEWGRLGTSLVVWLGIPLGVGLWRLWRSEVK